jgi:pSer/pThr/pTyr-binding forkhead associated (FHA) protein
MVNEVFVSRHHAEVRAEEGGRYVLYPTGSTPTIMNELPIEAPAALQEGDTFTVGTMKFVFTQNRLPVAMAVAEPMTRSSPGVDDRRPTLTFPLQGTTKQDGPSTVWIVMAVVLVVVALVIYQFI